MNLTGVKGEALGHLGLVAATIQDMGVMEKIDGQLGLIEGGIRYGQRVGAMVLNGLMVPILVSWVFAVYAQSWGC